MCTCRFGYISIRFDLTPCGVVVIFFLAQNDGGIASQHPPKESLDWVMHEGDFLSNYEWFEEHFPPEKVTMAHALGSFRLLERLHEASA